MGDYLLKGYKMLDECCDACGVSSDVFVAVLATNSVAEFHRSWTRTWWTWLQAKPFCNFQMLKTLTGKYCATNKLNEIVFKIINLMCPVNQVNFTILNCG